MRTATAVVMMQFVSSPLVAQASKGVHVCLGTDNLLHFTSGDRCPQGQRLFRLAEVEDEAGVTKDRDDPPNAVVADLKTKVDLLTRRVANLEAELSKPANDPKIATQVKAPFEVVDKRGNPIFVVSEEHDAVRRGRVHIDRGSGNNNFRMLFNGSGGSVVAGIGEGKGGGGAIALGTSAGVTRIDLDSDAGVAVNNASGKNVALIAAGPQGAGQLWLYDAGGQPMVKAGTLGAIGTVEVGPGNKCVAVGSLRVPDCIRGRTQ